MTGIKSVYYGFRLECSHCYSKKGRSFDTMIQATMFKDRMGDCVFCGSKREDYNIVKEYENKLDQVIETMVCEDESL